MSTTTERRFVAYYRVSTQRQGQSGLGLEAQQAMAEQHAGAKGHIVEAFTEVESGRRSARPQLAAAIDACKRHAAVLIVASLDRLTRDTVFLAKLRESNVEFVCCDMPEADRFTINIIAAVAEKEALAISTRTKRALAAKKARGEKWGAALEPEKYAGTLQRGRAKNEAEAAAWKARVYDRCRSLRDAGRSLVEIAAILTGAGERTRRGKPFTSTAVLRILGGQTGGHFGRF